MQPEPCGSLLQALVARCSGVTHAFFLGGGHTCLGFVMQQHCQQLLASHACLHNTAGNVPLICCLFSASRTSSWRLFSKLPESQTAALQKLLWLYARVVRTRHALSECHGPEQSSLIQALLWEAQVPM